jgi:hypothetical protein
MCRCHDKFMHERMTWRLDVRGDDSFEEATTR